MRRRRSRAPRRWRWLTRSVLGLLVVVLAGGAIGYGWLRTGLPQTRGRVALPGLQHPVEVLRDADGVPHIFAATDEDGYHALGFVHAQDRLFQMDFQRRLGAGRLAEVAGPAALPVDKSMRTLGIYRAAEASLAHLSAPVRRALDAYARGVNAFLETREGALPPEYYVLRTEPEPWRAADSLVWARLMALTLSGNWRGEALRTRLALRLTPQQLGDWYADDNFAGPVTLPPGVARTHAADALMERALAALPEALHPRLASNIWVVDGRHTASGKPILANDPHLGFGAPALWYLARLTTPTVSLAGATVAGVPFHVLGQNHHIAWGMTTTGADTQDLVIERVAADPDSYETPGGPRRFEVRQEVIKVRGGDDVVLSVRATRHGPVISDVEASATTVAQDKQVVALATTALRPDDRTPEALYLMNRADDWDAFAAALERFEAPMQNVFYADKDGTTAMVSAGLIPVRRSGNGFMPGAGWDDSAAWDGFVPFAELPRRVAPPDGVLVNANNRVIGDDYPHFISRDWDQPYRAQRIETLLGATPGGQTVARHEAIQLDIVSPMTAELLPLMLARAEPSSRAADALRRLAQWDGSMARGALEPLLFVTWLRALDRALFADELGDLFPLLWDLHPKLIARTLRAEAAWCDDVATPARETCAQQVTRALGEALDALAERGSDPRWGDAHVARHDHPVFGRIAVLRWLADLPIPADGGNDTVNRGAMRISNTRDPFADVHGAGYRAVYDLADPAGSRFVIATGQSGNFLSRHYADFLQRWRDGVSRPLTGTPAALAAAGADRLMLVPR